jgi:hypothetical protein
MSSIYDEIERSLHKGESPGRKAFRIARQANAKHRKSAPTSVKPPKLDRAASIRKVGSILGCEGLAEYIITDKTISTEAAMAILSKAPVVSK